MRFRPKRDYDASFGKLYLLSPPIAGECRGKKLASLSNGVTADNRLQLVTGMPRWEMMISGEKGTLRVTHERTWLQRLYEDEATELDPAEQGNVPYGEDLLQHTWNRLIADFVTAIRNNDKSRANVPNLPALADGLKAQQVLASSQKCEKKA